MSTTKADYIALSAAFKEAIWLNNIITDLRPLHIKTILVNCDNNGAININKNYMYHVKSMHMDIQHYFVWETVKTGHITVKVCKL